MKNKTKVTVRTSDILLQKHIGHQVTNEPKCDGKMNTKKVTQKKKERGCIHLRFWNQTLICLGSILERIGHSLMSCCLLKELGLGHSEYTLSKASTCSGVYLTYLLESIICLFANSLLCIVSAITHNTTQCAYHYLGALKQKTKFWLENEPNKGNPGGVLSQKVLERLLLWIWFLIFFSVQRQALSSKRAYSLLHQMKILFLCFFSFFFFFKIPFVCVRKRTEYEKGQSEAEEKMA